MLHTTTRSGKAPPLVLVHGWTCDHTAMLPVADAFPDQQLVLPDLLGHGKSPRTGDYSIGAQAVAALEVAPEAAIWVGHSMGAQIAVEAAAQAPGRVTAAVLLDPAPIAPWETALKARDRTRTGLAEATDFPGFMEAFARGMLGAATDAAAAERLVATQRAADPDVSRAGWDAIWDWDGSAALARVECPVLVITVEKTLNRLPDIARLNRNVTTAQVACSGHMLQFEVMNQVAAMMRRFLEVNRLVSCG